MGATRPHNPAARGEPLGATAPWQNRSQPKKNKPTLNTKLRILPIPGDRQPLLDRFIKDSQVKRGNWVM